MSSKVLFSSVEFAKLSASATLPAKFKRMLEKTGVAPRFKNKTVAIKMHVGSGIGYTTVHPLFVRILVDYLKEGGANVYVTDQLIKDAPGRGYTLESLGVPIVPVCGHTDKYIYEKPMDMRGFVNLDIGGNIADADAMIVLSHFKGHGVCGYGAACKNLGMGCVTDRTRAQIHSLEGVQEWDEELCTHCNACIESCNHKANKFTEDGKYEVFYHNCTYCQHCSKVCPTGAIKTLDNRYRDFQTGLAMATEGVLNCFDKDMVYYINFLTNITILCDCWGLSTPSFVPDIGIMASEDIVAIERASLDKIKVENFIPQGVPTGHVMGEEGHLIKRIHGKDPFIQIEELEKRGLGTQQYIIEEVE
jgi:uncharacterized Fe-S center protein